ncbi:MAG: hypothetical protein JXA89_17750 [Anaerolineae bacterium]|nr:hypothetical protein [Anaerolineae bacterium]
MNELWLRFKAIVGSLKVLAFLVLIFAGLFFLFAVSDLYSAIINPNEPKNVSIGQLVDGTIGSSRYVQISGYANYRFGYTQTEDGKIRASYYVMLDDHSGDLIVVKAETTTAYGKQDGDITLTGMTRNSASDLKQLIKDDLPKIQEAGFQTNPGRYIEQGAKPPSLILSLFLTFMLGTVSFLCLITFIFPSTVFAPAALDLDVMQPVEKSNPGVRAIGQFQRLKDINPEIVLGKGKQKLRNSVANIIPRAERDLIIYIHRIVRTKRYGITLSKQESDWGIFINGDNLDRLESGLLYGWKNRRATRFHYRNAKGKQESLILWFEYDWSHADAVKLFQKMGFAINEGNQVV